MQSVLTAFWAFLTLGVCLSLYLDGRALWRWWKYRHPLD